MKILVVNCGSSSVKYQVFDMRSDRSLASGLVERIGEPLGRISYAAKPENGPERTVTREAVFADHEAGLRAAISLLEDPEVGVIAHVSEIKAVGHRVVHGGERFSEPAVVDDAVVEAIREAAVLAPLHNYASAMGVETARAIFPGVPQTVVFDTAFHQTMPPRAYVYALPYEFYEKHHIRRYGFHGTSHRYVAERAAERLGKPLGECDLITAHLGNGCSMAAIKRGKSVDTSMGLTPLAGLVMGTRCGDIDPQAPLFLIQHENQNADSLDALFNKKSGLLGVCGSNDMRDVHKRRQAGDERAQLAFELFCHGVRKYLGAYLAVLGRADAVVFTAGIGEHDALTRQGCLEGLENLGLILDPEKNAALSGAGEISREDSSVRIFVIPTNEELEIARQTVRALAGA